MTRFGQESYRPIILRRAHHEPPTVFRYYRAADVCYVSSLHDGMNLVAKEFVAAREDERGVLVLSQFTGAARELTEALIVNPYDLDEASSALATALQMSPVEQRDRMRSMRAFLSEFNVYRWAGRMLVDAARLRSRDRLTGRSEVPTSSPCRDVPPEGFRISDFKGRSGRGVEEHRQRVVERQKRGGTGGRDAPFQCAGDCGRLAPPRRDEHDLARGENRLDPHRERFARRRPNALRGQVPARRRGETHARGHGGERAAWLEVGQVTIGADADQSDVRSCPGELPLVTPALRLEIRRVAAEEVDVLRRQADP